MQARKALVVLGGALAFLVPFCVYLATLSPTLNFWDCGEFITTSFILGIPHPPATPMYVLVGRLASILPLGVGIAQKINMMSAFFGALASLMMYLLVFKFARAWRGAAAIPDWILAVGGLVGAWFIAFSDTFWINSIEAEVYSLSAFLMGFTLWLVLDWSDHADNPRGNALVYLILYLLSLAVGFHLGTILVFPGFFVLALLTRNKSFSDLELWLVGLALALFLGSTILHMPDLIMFVGLALIFALSLYLARRSPANGGSKLKPALADGRYFVLFSLLLFVLGLSVHLFLYIRAGQHPAINEADPSSWKNLWAVLKREQYPFQLPTERKAALGWQFMHFFRYFAAQFRMPDLFSLSLGNFRFHASGALMAIPIGLGILGGVWQWIRQRKHCAALGTILLLNTLGLVLFLNFSAEEVRERDYFYANGFYFFAVFIGLGAAGLLELLRNEKRGTLLSGIAASLLVLATFGPLNAHWFTHDRSENLIARDYAYNMLAPLEKNAVIFTNGDNDTFPLWYIQEVEGLRKDIRVVNLSLLNTDWYMRQLRDQPPQLPITWSDDQVAETATYYVREPDGRIRQPRDYVIDHMLVNTQRSPAGWESRPYYFAVTIPRETLRPFLPYLSMEGMVYRMTLKEGTEQVDLAKLRENLEDNFEWRGILTLDKSVDEPAWAEGKRQGSLLDRIPAPEDPTLNLPRFFKDETTRHLVQNYAAAWSRLAIEMDRGGLDHDPDPQLAVRSMEMARLIREDLTPVVLFLGYLYMRNGEYEKAVSTYEHFLQVEPNNWQLWARYAQALEGAGEKERVVEALGKVIQLNPDYEPAYLSLLDWIISYFPSRQNLGALQRQLTEYLERHPDSAPLRKALDTLNETLNSTGDEGAGGSAAPPGAAPGSAGDRGTP